MRRLIQGSLVCITLFAAACSGNDKDKKETSVNNAAPLSPADTSLQGNTGGPVLSEDLKREVVVPSGTGVVSGPLNPPHGQPGHRCDIPEGAPLNGTPATGGQPAMTAPATGAPAGGNSLFTTPGTARLNPAHGQPGHRCDINVGDPLPQ